MNSDEAHRRAEALFKKDRQCREGQQTRPEYQAELRATREKTARLRALRLARDSANQKTPPANQGCRVARQSILSARAVMLRCGHEIGVAQGSHRSARCHNCTD